MDIAGFTDNGTKIKDVSKDVLKGWIGQVASATSADNGVVASGSNYVRFGDGTQICWGQTNSGDATKFVATFPVPFFNTNYSIVVDGIGVRETKTTTSCKFVYVDKTFSNGSYGREWLAIGRWA